MVLGSIAIDLVVIVAALYLINKGSEKTTDAISHTARVFRTSNVAVSIVLVALLLSMPEVLISASSILKGKPDLAIGVAIGSLIVNLGLIVGVSAIIRPIKLSRVMITRDLVFMIVATLVVSLVGMGNGQFSRLDGAIFLLLFIPYIINVYEQEKMLTRKERAREEESISRTLELTGKWIHSEKARGLLPLLFGLALLVLGSELFTRSLVSIANITGIPGIIIGLTVGAIGTSIPNLATAVQAARRNMDGVAISETLGSNIFTLLVTVGVISLIAPVSVDEDVRNITIPAMLAMTFISSSFFIKGVVGKKEGVTLVLMYLTLLAAEILGRTAF